MPRRPGEIFRNGGLQLAGGGGQGPGAPLYGLTEWDTVNRLGTVADQGLRGDVAGFWIRCICWITSQAVANTARVLTMLQANGYRFRISGTNTTSDTQVFTTVLGYAGPIKTFVAGDVGKALDLVLVYDPGGGFLRVFCQGAEVGTGTAVSGVYIPNAGGRMPVGVREVGTTPADANGIAGIEGGDGFVPSSAEIAAAHALTRGRLRSGLLPFPAAGSISGKTTGVWQFGSAWNPPVIVDDEIGTDDWAIFAGSAAGLVLANLAAPVQWAP